MLRRINRIEFIGQVGLGLALLALLAVLPAQAGVFYRADTTVETTDRGPGQHMVVEGWIDGANAKILFTESNNEFMPQGSYLLTQDAGETLYLVNPADKSYMDLDLAKVFGTLDALTQGMGGLVDINVSAPDVKILGEDEGDEILGMATRRFQVRSTYGIEVKVMGIKQSYQTETLQEIWVAQGFDDPAMSVWLNKAPPRTGDKDIDALIAAETNKVKGFPLMTRAVSTMTSGRKGKRQTTTTTTTEVTKLETREVPAADFALPEGYEKKEMLDEAALSPFGVPSREQ